MRISSTLFSFLVAAALSGSAHAQDWVQWPTANGGNGHWYKAVINTNGLTWAQMDQIAASEGGYLATITSDAENQFVFSLINAPEFFSGDGNNGAGPALGGYQLDNQPDAATGWVWETGEPWSFTSWAPGQPDLPFENRLHYWSGTQGVPAPTWNNVVADNSNIGGYVIERDNMLSPSRTGFYGQAFFGATGGTLLKPLLGVPARATISVYNAKGKLSRRLQTNLAGQFFAEEKPANYTLIATQFKQPLPPNNLSQISTSDWATVQFTVKTNSLTPIQINITPAPTPVESSGDKDKSLK